MTRGNAALVAVQPGFTNRVKLCALAAEVCRGNEGTHKGADIEYLRMISRLGHLSVFEHARYVRPMWINRERREYGRALSSYMESVNARYVIEHEGYNPVFKFSKQKETPYHKLTDAQKLAHASATFMIQCSRVCSHQIVRHRTGSFSQQSQRHVKPQSIGELTKAPLSIAGDPVISVWYQFLHEKIAEFASCATKRGVPLEDIRYMFPGSTKTRLLVTMTFENWIHFIKLRTANAAQLEIRELASEIKVILTDHDPVFFKKVMP